MDSQNPRGNFQLMCLLSKIDIGKCCSTHYTETQHENFIGTIVGKTYIFPMSYVIQFGQGRSASDIHKLMLNRF
jgi:hypothetical protein